MTYVGIKPFLVIGVRNLSETGLPTPGLLHRNGNALYRPPMA